MLKEYLSTHKKTKLALISAGVTFTGAFINQLLVQLAPIGFQTVQSHTLEAKFIYSVFDTLFRSMVLASLVGFVAVLTKAKAYFDKLNS